MKQQLILASASVQRKKLLALLGIPFKVIPSQVEEHAQVDHNFAHLVKHNALIKAKDVAARVKNGIVIGSDTLVCIGKKTIIGKPKTLAVAKKNLKHLMNTPHWVYTGVAVIDSTTGKTLVDYEKTKVFMVPLTDKEIDMYHQRVPPFDKAGGFDIEGLGSVFIRRIEGDYSNVIGLPLAKLFSMLKKIGVKILGVLLIANLLGCTSEYNLATQREESLMYGTDKEVSVGDAFAAQIEKQFEVVTDVDINERANAVLKRLVAVCDRQDLVYFIKVLKEDSVNAVSLPGGYVYIFSGLMDKIKDDEELAAVVGHEIGHITARHAIKRLQAAYGALLLQILSTRANGHVSQGVGLALATVFTEYSQKDEFEADRLGVKYMKKAGYNPAKVVSMLELLEREQDKEPLRPHSYWRTHPHIPERIAAANQEITGKLEFKDYIKLIGE
jgi:MAF protein